MVITSRIKEPHLVINNHHPATLNSKGIGVSHIRIGKLNSDRCSNRPTNDLDSLGQRQAYHIRAIDRNKKPVGFDSGFLGGRTRMDGLGPQGSFGFFRWTMSSPIPASSCAKAANPNAKTAMTAMVVIFICF